MSASRWGVKFLSLILVALFLNLMADASAEYEKTEIEYVDHTQFFQEANVTVYEGSKTCISCHPAEVREFLRSHHYQLASVQRDIAGYDEILYGGRFTYNEYCGVMFWKGEKVINWIGYLRLKKPPEGYEELKGKFTGLTGCSMCHSVGMGLPPSFEATQEQLENIDCLACHADPKVYVSGPIGIAKKMKNVTKLDGGFRYVITVPLEALAKNMMRVPTKDSCLACHAFSGGGPHLKRPNLSPELMGDEVSEDFDVHIGRGMECVDCHKVVDHKFPTASVDTFSREGGIIKSCDSCHGSDPHGGLWAWFLNTFHDRVACQTCHIPYVAHGKFPTDMARDWSATTFIPKKTRYKFAIPDPETQATDKWYLRSDVIPYYAWYNGTREVYIYPTEITPSKDYPEYEMDPVNGESLGVVFYTKPLGSKDDPSAKIYPFKLRKAVMPYSKYNKTFVPIKAGIAFVTGDAQAATMKAAKETGLRWEKGDYVTMVRMMQINHGVVPKEKALFCFDCHGITENRVDWDGLGYGILPKVYFALLILVPLMVVIVVVYRKMKR